MTLHGLLAALFSAVMVSTASGQAPSPPPQLNAVTYTAYSKNTELFAEWRPLTIGEATRLTAHLTRTGGDGFKPYTEGKVTLTLTVEAAVANAAADGPERPRVFRLNVTPQKSGTGRIVIDVSAATGDQHFVIDNVPVYANAAAALARQSPPETGLISFAKERSWEQDFATAPPTILFPGAGRIFMVPAAAIVRDGATARVFVQRTPERFELREIQTRRTVGGNVEVIAGLRDGERIVVRGADKMPRQ
jgi:hypothetical protein